jgi:hypothetical protein
MVTTKGMQDNVGYMPSLDSSNEDRNNAHITAQPSTYSRRALALPACPLVSALTLPIDDLRVLLSTCDVFHC